ncbi:MAG: hypothetical protein RL685_590 [Pseudomonadota bacterium]
MAEPRDGGLREAWAKAFLRQGKADLDTFLFLSAWTSTQVPVCHRLQFLQMAGEKIAKAYRIRDTAAPLEGESGLLTRHVGFHKFLRAFLLSPSVRRDYEGRDEQYQVQSRMVLQLARQVERLAPSVDQLTSPENVEYPWRVNEEVVAPCDHDFSRLSLLAEPGGRTLLKLLRRAVDDFGAIRI